MTDLKNRISEQRSLVKCYYVFLCYLIGGELVCKPILQFTHSFLHVPGKIDTLILYAIIAFIAVCGLYGKLLFSRFRLKITEIILLCALLSFLLIGYMRSTGYTDMFFEMLQQFALGIVSYVFFRYCDDRERLLNDMAVLSVIMTVAMILLPLLAGRGELFDASYSQYYAYMVFPAFIISMNETIRRKSVFYGLVAAVCLVMTFMMGARGPVILELLFVIIRFIDEPIHPLGKVITSVAVAGGGTFIYFNMYTILELLNRLAVSMDFSNRLFKKLVQGTLYDSGRDGIYAAALQMIDRHPLTGVGIGTDRIALARLVNSSNPLGTYSHNFLLDLLVQFGIVIGTVIMIGFIILAVRAFIVSRKTSSGKNIFWVMLMIGFAPLLFSSSYITYPLFFAMLAMWQSDFET